MTELTPADSLAQDLVMEVRGCTSSPLPLPGRGGTRSRFAAFADMGARDLCVAKIAEPHHDAVAILADLAGPSVDEGTLWGVWAAEPPHARVLATRRGEGWELTGTKAFCSGADLVTHALVTAEAEDGTRLFAIDVEGGRRADCIELAGPDWVGPGMRRAGTRTLHIQHLPATAVGDPHGYVRRPGFWHGSVGVAACWLGGARTVAQRVLSTAQRRELDPHALAHLGAMTAVLDAASAHLLAIADRIDADPADTSGAAQLDAQSVRASVVSAAETVMTRTAHALGPAPLAFDAAHAQRVADLAVFIRQHHAERDLADLGRLVVERDAQT